MIRELMMRSYMASATRLNWCGVGCAVFIALPVSVIGGRTALAVWAL